MKKARLRKKAKGLLYASNIWCVSEGMIGPLFALFGEKIGGSILDVSIAWALYLTMSGILIMFIGKISDKSIRKEALLIAGYIILTIFTFGYIFVDSRETLFLVQIGLGIGTSLATPTWDALYAKHTRRSKDGYAWGMANGQADLITGLATVIGGLVVNYISFNFLFLLMGIIEFVATMVLIKTIGKDAFVKITEEKPMEIATALKVQKQAS